MQTHPDNDIPTPLRPEAAIDRMLRNAASDGRMDRLRERAAEMVEKGESQITAGRPGEQVLGEREVFGVFVRRLPDDPDCLRISVGEFGDVRYLVIRGEPEDCLGTLERAVRALRASIGKL